MRLPRRCATLFCKTALLTHTSLRVLAGLATVGFGDIHAKGQLARLLVIAQMLFNVVVLAAAFRVLAGAARARRG